jgi:hypothetical protein
MIKSKHPTRRFALFLNVLMFDKLPPLGHLKRRRPKQQTTYRPEVHFQLRGSILSNPERCNHEQTAYAEVCSFFECAAVRQADTIGTYESTTSTLNAKTWQIRSSFQSARFIA